ALVSGVARIAVLPDHLEPALRPRRECLAGHDFARGKDRRTRAAFLCGALHVLERARLGLVLRLDLGVELDRLGGAAVGERETDDPAAIPGVAPRSSFTLSRHVAFSP